MIYKPRGDWCYYLACSTCRAAAASPCLDLRGLRSRMRHRVPLDRPHKGRERSTEDQTPKRPPTPMCPHWHPSFGPNTIMCGRTEHAHIDVSHAHYSAKYGAIFWRA